MMLLAGERKISEAKPLNEAKRRELSPDMKGGRQTELHIVSSRRKDRLLDAAQNSESSKS